MTKTWCWSRFRNQQFKLFEGYSVV